jgi:uncharacterized protein YjiS (DUF1127 family)
MNLYHDAWLVSRGPQILLRESVIFLARLRQRLSHTGAFWAAWLRREREVQALYAFSDRELWDLGLGRADLQRIRNGTFRRDGT